MSEQGIIEGDDEPVRPGDIIEGDEELGYPSAVYLTNWDGDSGGYRTGPFCTGVVIAPTVVLTAAHCVDDRIPHAPGFGVGTGAALDADGHARGGRVIIPADEIIVHPLYHDVYANGREDDDRPIAPVRHDLALVFVDQPFDVTPATVSYEPPLASTRECAPVHAVGYGKTVCDDNYSGGPRKGAEMCLQLIQTGQLRINADTGFHSHGDSGGPIYAGAPESQTLVGIHWGSGCAGLGDFAIATAWQRRFIDGGKDCADRDDRFACLFPVGDCAASEDRYCTGIQVACSAADGCDLFGDTLDYLARAEPAATVPATPWWQSLRTVYEVLAASGELMLVRRADGEGESYWTSSRPTDWELVPAPAGYAANAPLSTAWKSTCIGSAYCGAYRSTNLLSRFFQEEGSPFPRGTRRDAFAYDHRPNHRCGVLSMPRADRRFAVSLACQRDGWLFQPQAN